MGQPERKQGLAAEPEGKRQPWDGVKQREHEVGTEDGPEHTPRGTDDSERGQDREPEPVRDECARDLGPPQTVVPPEIRAPEGPVVEFSDMPPAGLLIVDGAGQERGRQQQAGQRVAAEQRGPADAQRAPLHAGGEQHDEHLVVRAVLRMERQRA